ncbi:MAG: hypothetical protein R3F11_13305 [Verrucomicrobiales bacterium]
MQRQPALRAARGFTSDDPAALLPNPRFDDILREAQEIADVIIIDTPVIDFCSDALALRTLRHRDRARLGCELDDRGGTLRRVREFTRHGAPPKCAGAVLNAGA